MLTSNTFLLITITISLIAICFAQQRRVSGRRDRTRQRGRARASQAPEQVVAQRISCYFCTINFALNKFDVNNLCYNPNKNLTAADLEYTTLCPTSSKFCLVDITRVNGGLTVVDRKCGGSTCNYFCIIKGYGIEIQTCTHCCDGRVPVVNNINNQEINENPAIDYYRCPDMSKIRV